MLQKFHKRNRKGFTLIELMIVVVIIGILAALAIPRFMKASAKSKTSEAQLILKQIYTMQRSYKQQHDTYAGAGMLADLGVEVPPNANYTYTIEAADDVSFTAQADWPDPGLDDDATPDTWTIDENGDIVHTSDDLTG